MKLPISVIILTYNEETNIKDCIESVIDWTDEVFIVDSESTDKTIEIAKLYTDKICTHRFDNYAQQRNWAQKALPIKNEWVLHLDADERISPQLAREIKNIFSSKIDFNGYMMPRKTIFRGQWIRYGGHYPSYHLRLFKKDKGKSEERFYDQHYVVDGAVSTLKADIVNIITPDINKLISKYKIILEAKEILFNDARMLNIKFRGNPIEHINWLRYRVYYKTPILVRPMLYFIYRYIIRLGFLDGKNGAVFHFYQGFLFKFLIDMEIFKFKYAKNDNTRNQFISS